MHLPRSASATPGLVILPEAGSTNDEMTRLAREGADDFTVVVTDSQTAGRGRLDRVWSAPPGATLAASVLLRVAGLAPDRLGWIPLLAGAAMHESLSALVDADRVGVKWPNDVLIGDRKVCGILAELVSTSSGPAVVLGAGVNLHLTEEQLPVPTATSLALEGATVTGDDLADAVLVRYLSALRRLVTGFAASGGEAEAGGRAAVERACTTLGRRVRVELPDGSRLTGVAEGIDADGRIRVRGSDDRVQAVAAGDVTHLRYE